MVHVENISQSLVESSPDAIVVSNHLGQIVFVNSQTEKLFGYERGSLVGLNIEILLPNFIHERHKIRLHSQSKLKILNDSKELLGKHKNNDLLSVEVNLSPLEDDSLVAVFIRDIRDRKQIQDKLKVSEQQFRRAFEYSAIGMGLVSTDGKWLKVNWKICDILGYEEEELLGKSYKDITHPDDLELDLKYTQELLRGESDAYQMEKRYIHKNGSLIWAILSVSLVRSSEGLPLHFVSQIQNITKRKIAEEKLKYVNQQLSAILNSATQVAIISTDPSGIVTHFSKGAEELLGYSASEIEQLHTPGIFHLEEELDKRGIELTQQFGREIKGFDVFVEFARQGKHESRTWTYVRKDGSTFPVQLSVTAILEENNVIKGFLGIATDITEQVKNQKILEESKGELEILSERLSKQNEQLLNFAHITSHNLRSPASNLSSLLFLYRQEDDKERKDVLFEKFETVIHHLTTTLNELVEALKIQEGTKKQTEHIAFEETLKKIQAIISGQILQSNSIISTNFEVANILYNKTYLESIFLNLLTNAIKYSSPKRRPRIHIETKQIQDELILSFRDNGLGIDLQKNANKLFGFHKTFHRHAEAKGVGLFLTKTQVEAMGGKISIESEVDKGTKFIINFSPKS
jgi:PAS domain S-box-containing protein